MPITRAAAEFWEYTLLKVPRERWSHSLMSAIRHKDLWKIAQLISGAVFSWYGPFFSRLPMPKNTPYSEERMNRSGRYFQQLVCCWVSCAAVCFCCLIPCYQARLPSFWWWVLANAHWRFPWGWFDRHGGWHRWWYDIVRRLTISEPAASVHTVRLRWSWLECW